MHPQPLITNKTWKHFCVGNSNDAGAISTYIQTTEDIIGFLQTAAKDKSAEEIKELLSNFLEERKSFITYAYQNTP